MATTRRQFLAEQRATVSTVDGEHGFGVLDEDAAKQGSDFFSAGFVCFEIAGRSPAATVHRLRERGVIASTTPYATSGRCQTPP